MKYIVCETPGKFVLKEKEPPIRKEGEALVRILKIGICGTDLHAFRGRQPFFEYPRILGHELAAEIIEIDANNKGLKKGDKVIIMPYLSCGQCIACRNEKTNCCTQLKVLGVHTDGGMQEIMSLPINILIPGKSLATEAMALVEPLSIGAHCIRRAAIKSGETVLVVGAGPIGLGILKQAQLAGARVISMDINQQRLSWVAENLGNITTINALNNPLESILSINNGELPTVVVDATGNKKALESGVEYMAHGGKYVLVGLTKGNLTFHNPSIQKKETTLLCSRNATPEDFQQVIDILEKDLFPWKAYITHRVNFADMLHHFESWTEPKSGVIKAMITLS